MIERALSQLLQANATVAGYVGTRVYPIRVPQDGQYPCVVYTRVDTPRLSHLRGSSRLAHPRVQLDCLATVYEDAKALGDAVRSLLDAYRGTASGKVIQGCHLVDEEESDQKPLNADDLPLFRCRLDFEVWYEETGATSL